MSKAEISLDLIGKFGLVVVAVSVGIALINSFLTDSGEPGEYIGADGNDVYCESVSNSSVLNKFEFLNLLDSYYNGCSKVVEAEMGFTLLKEDLENFASEEGISSGGKPSLLYRSMEECRGVESFKGIVIDTDNGRVLFREGEKLVFKRDGESVVVCINE